MNKKWFAAVREQQVEDEKVYSREDVLKALQSAWGKICDCEKKHILTPDVATAERVGVVWTAGAFSSSIENEFVNGCSNE